MNSRTEFTVEGIHGLGAMCVISWPTGHFGDESIVNYKQYECAVICRLPVPRFYGDDNVLCILAANPLQIAV